MIYSSVAPLFFAGRDGKIETNLLYPILLRSTLDKQVLGQLWSLCNKQTPGQLSRHELVLLLAMIAVAQVRIRVKTPVFPNAPLVLAHPLRPS